MKLPVVALRGLCILPDMLVHFDINRKKSIAAIEAAMIHGQKILVLTQKDSEVNDPGENDLYRIGTIIKINQLIKLPNNLVRVMAEGLERAEITELLRTEPFLEADCEEALYLEDVTDEAEQEAMLRVLKEKMEIFCSTSHNFAENAGHQLLAINDLEVFLEQAAAKLPLDWEKKQAFLELCSTGKRFKWISRSIDLEIEVAGIRQSIQDKVKQRIDKNQREYILREQIKVIREELGEDDTVSDADHFEEQLNALKAGKDVKEKVRKEIRRFRSIPSGSQEGTVSRTYIETLLELPWQKMSRDSGNIARAEQILNEDHYGLDKIKERILEHLAVRSLAGGHGGSILCLVGPPGTGKTSIARSVARALNKKYVRVSLGGVRDEAEIRGHRRTYIGAMPGRIAAGLKQAGTANPLMLLDEIDKVSSDYKGDTASALLEVLDSEQNVNFRDHYIEIPIDLSPVLFIATANTTSTIPGPLLDRMDVIEVSSYTENEKFHIAKEYLAAKQLKKSGFTGEQVTFDDSCLHGLIQHYTREAGVRSLERRIGDICRKLAKEYLENPFEHKTLTEQDLENYLGKQKVRSEKINDEDEVGLVRGLAWTSVGGTTLEVEVNCMPGTGKLQLTGQMGDVMKESAQAALTYVRSVAGEYGTAEDYFEKHDIHMHIPEGAVPKDGPSAGITMSTAMLSAVTGRRVRRDVAMTGEVTLRGRVLPIGGLKEKLLAANMAGAKTVLIPEENKADLQEISAEIIGEMEIVPVSHMKDVIQRSFR